ncbi:unnamed protein product [Lepidochelys kempii]
MDKPVSQQKTAPKMELSNRHKKSGWEGFPSLLAPPAVLQHAEVALSSLDSVQLNFRRDFPFGCLDDEAPAAGLQCGLGRLLLGGGGGGKPGTSDRSAVGFFIRRS